jgi:hypothetical protein
MKLVRTPKAGRKEQAKVAGAGALVGAAAVAGLTVYGLKKAGRTVVGTFLGDRPS